MNLDITTITKQNRVEEGGKQNKTGKNGEDLIIKVPEGTIIREAETGKDCC